jgi:hypothetical protein
MQMRVPSYPNVRLFEGGRVHEAPSRDPDDIVAFALRHVAAERTLPHEEL